MVKKIMKMLIINGSPRKTGNTATFLNKALEGASSQSAETKLINLRELNFRGCNSCLICKTNGKYRGKCAYIDDLSPILEEVKNIDALILGSPIYLGTATSDMRAFLERLYYPYLNFDADNYFIFPGEIDTGFIYTMGASEQRMKEAKFDQYIAFNEVLLNMFGLSESLIINSTNLYYDNSKNNDSSTEHGKRIKLFQEEFKEYCNKAFEMGVRFAKSIKE